MHKYQNIALKISLLLSSPFRKQKRRQIRMMMRGYRYLKREGRLHIIEDTVQHLRSFKLQIPTESLPKFLWGQALRSAELIVRQRLSSRNSVLVRALLIASSTPLGKVVASFPHSWLVEIQCSGFKVDYFRSSVLWNLFLVKCICDAVFKGIIVINESLFVAESRSAYADPYIYFFDLTASNIPSGSDTTESDCIVSWYAHWPHRRRAIHNLRHSVTYSRTQQIGSYCLQYQSTPIPPLASHKKKIVFTFIFIASLFCQAVSFFTGRWWNLLLYQEFIISLQLRLQSTGIAAEYWFHNSLLYPPLWVYELPAMGSKCIYYFYSTNIEPFVFRDDETLPLISPYTIMNWPEYVVWDECQYSFTKRCHVDASNISVVGPIPFSHDARPSSSCLTPVSSGAIAVFDVQPFRDSKYQGYGFASEFYIPDHAIQFFRDILSCASELNITLLIKRKRDIGHDAHPKYRRFLSSLSSLDNIVFVDPGVSASSLVRYSIGSVSMPYTSTAVVFREAGIQSVYYMPMIERRLSSYPSHGIPLIRDVGGLRLWMNALIGKYFVSRDLPRRN
jgi:polysaccharide biosynthesis PFTS motif protein